MHGDEHVDAATARATDLTREFQELLTRYAWGEIWTRPGLDRRTRSLHHDRGDGGARPGARARAAHLRSARRNGVEWDEIKEVLLQSAIYCGVPAANSAFAIAQR